MGGLAIAANRQLPQSSMTREDTNCERKRGKEGTLPHAERARERSRPVTSSTDHTSQIGGTEIAFEFSSGDEASCGERLDGRRISLGSLSLVHVIFSHSLADCATAEA